MKFQESQTFIPSVHHWLFDSALKRVEADSSYSYKS